MYFVPDFFLTYSMVLDGGGGGIEDQKVGNFLWTNK